MIKKYPIAIIGNGGAAITAIKALRQSAFDGPIHLFSDDSDPPYNPMLGTYFAAGKIPFANCFPFGASHQIYRDYQVDASMGSPVVDLDAEKQLVKTAKGESLVYSQCLIASGASAVIPPIPGIKGKNVLTLRTAHDAVQLKEALNSRPRKAVVIGASLVGIKVVELFWQAGMEVCWAEQAARIFPTLASEEMAAKIQDYLVAKNIKFRLGASVQGIEESAGGTMQVYFSDHPAPEEADLVFIGIGARANTQFLNPQQVNLERGVLVEDDMKTSMPNLFAAGDVAQGRDPLSGQKKIAALWSNALYQGRTAGRNMAGGSERYPGSIPHNITHFMDMTFVSMGDPLNGGDQVQSWDPDQRTSVRLVIKDHQIVGANLLNIEGAGVLKYHMTKSFAQVLNRLVPDGGMRLFQLQHPGFLLSDQFEGGIMNG